MCAAGPALRSPGYGVYLCEVLGLLHWGSQADRECLQRFTFNVYLTGMDKETGMGLVATRIIMDAQGRTQPLFAL